MVDVEVHDVFHVIGSHGYSTVNVHMHSCNLVFMNFKCFLTVTFC